MIRLRAAVVLARHVYVVWRAGQLRFRLETFGLYYPAPPYTTPFWRVEVGPLLLFLRQSRAYARWVVEMDEIRRRGPLAWRDDGDGARNWPGVEAIETSGDDKT